MKKTIRKAGKSIMTCVDLYDNNGEIIFGEMTFTPACCCNAKFSREGDLSLGQLLEIKEC